MKQKQRLLMMLVMGLASFIYASAQTTVTINASNFKTYLEYKTNAAGGRWQFKNNTTTINALKNKQKILITGLPQTTTVKISGADQTVNVNNIYYNNSPAGLLANLEELEIAENHYITGITVNGTKLKKLKIGNNDVNWVVISADNSYLTQNDIVLGNKLKIATLILKRGAITDLASFYDKFTMTDPGVTAGTGAFQFNGGKYNRATMAGAAFEIINPTNLIREVDAKKIPTWWHVFLIRHNLLERVDMTGVNFANFNQFEMNNNLLWSLDFSSVTREPISNTSVVVGPQKPVADLRVEKGNAMDGSQDEVRLYLPEGQSELFNNSRLVSGSVKLLGKAVKTQAMQGTSTEKYFKLVNVTDDKIKADLDLYNKHNGFSYQYDTRPNLTDPDYAACRFMDVEVKTYPYIMYINPASKSSNVNYYSGTLWLDYDAIVPPNTTVWIVTDIKSKESIIGGGTAEPTAQLVMEKIGEPGQLIPAGTAMYVRSEAKEGEGAAGLYAFHKAWTHEPLGWDGGTTGEEQKAVAGDTLVYNQILTTAQQDELATQRAKINALGNLLEGYGTDKVFDNEREALILGLENQKGTGRIGFWPFNGTVVPAHRAFISEATYRSKVGDANAKGAIFFFNDPETTGITHIQNSDATTKNDAWYSLDGRQLTGKPTQKGVYIHKERKEVVR